MKINPQITAILQEFKIPVNDAVAYLLSVYFECRPSYTPPILIQRINVTNILGINSERGIEWNIPLFDTPMAVNTKWDWVTDWNNQFGLINPKRKGSLKTVLVRMKAFFAENPDVRQEEIIGATKLYFRSLTHRDYITSSHYFITKGVGKDRISALEVWVDKYREEVLATPPEMLSSDITNKMQ